MLPDLTPAVSRALAAATALASRENAAEVACIHLIHGLLDEEEGLAAERAKEAGLDWPAYRRSVSAIPGGASETALPLQPAAFAALRSARRLEMDLTGEREVTGVSLLLSLVRSEAGVRAALEPFGFRPDELEAHIMSRRGPPLQLDEPLDLTGSGGSPAAARVLDACANRAREGLRVVEDYCRFVLDDPFLTGELKRLRHDLAAALDEFAPDLLLSARDTPRDVGTSLTTTAEQERDSPAGVARANLKRLQEALRSLEEFGKLYGTGLGTALERLRYRAYTLEGAILLGTTARQRLENARLYVLLTAAQCGRSLEWTVAEAADGGAQVIQMREKDLPDRELLERARRMRRWTRQAGVLFIVNDRPDVTRLAEADGVHLGQDDVSVSDARRILGPDALVGVSTHNLEQVRQAVLDGASYIGVGPTFPSTTKAFDAYAGLEFVRAALAETTLPAFVIGGVNAQTIGAAVAVGARRVAVSQAIAGAESPRAAAAALRDALNKGSLSSGEDR
jgi:thiamine-phosphate pyrophosphorylase